MRSLGIESFAVKSDVFDQAITQLERSLTFFSTLKAKNLSSNKDNGIYRVPKEHKIIIRLFLVYFYKQK